MTSILNWMTTIVFFATIIYIIIKEKNEEEPYYALKVVGYYFLGAFRFSLNKLHIPLGFIIYLLFFRDAQQNQKGKKFAATLGFIALITSIMIPLISESYYERTRYADIIDTNIYNIDFEDQWLQVAQALKLEEHLINDAKVEDLRVDYEPDGQIKELRFDITWRENQQLYHANIYYGSMQKKFQIRPTLISEWLQYGRLDTAKGLFKKMNEINIKDMTNIIPKHQGAYFSFQGIDRGGLGVADAELFVLQKDKIVPYTGELPIQCSWFLIHEMRPSGEHSYSSADSYYFLFNLF